MIVTILLILQVFSTKNNTLKSKKSNYNRLRMSSVFKNPSYQFSNVSISTSRCILRPFHFDGIDFKKLAEDFCAANKDLFISQYLPNEEEEKSYIQEVIENMNHGNTLDFFIYDRNSENIIGCCGINALDTEEPNIGLWIMTTLHNQ